MSSRPIVLIADIHANNFALWQVIKHSKTFVERPVYWCLGDMLGRGPNWGIMPTLQQLDVLYTVKTPAEHRDMWLAGNHDLLITGAVEPVSVERREDESDQGDSATRRTIPIALDNLYTQQMASSHRQRLSDQNQTIYLDWLQSFKTYHIKSNGIYAVHGMFYYQDDILSEYETSQYRLEKTNDVQYIVNAIRQHESIYPKLIVYGHTHTQRLWIVDADGAVEKKQPDDICGQTTWLDAGDGQTIVLNPGSVGFPRGDNRCASYVILELSEDGNRFGIQFQRTGYDVDALLSKVDLEPDYPAVFRNEIMKHVRLGEGAC